jgi:hypothetical protein
MLRDCFVKGIPKTRLPPATIAAARQNYLIELHWHDLFTNTKSTKDFPQQIIWQKLTCDGRKLILGEPHFFGCQLNRGCL